MPNYDAILIVNFGGPEGPDDVMPFLENVTRGRGIPRERLLDVAHHYQAFGGMSPINQQTRDLIAALQTELDAHGPHLPIYWGNRNWDPYLTDTVQRMTDDGVRQAIAVFPSPYSSYSGCRQYRENIAAAREAAGPDAPTIDKLRPYFNHPGFIEPMTERVAEALADIPADRRASTRLVFTAHSIPTSMAKTSRYVEQLTESSRLVAERLPGHTWDLVYQSRSGPPQVPWLEPDVCDHLEALHSQGATDVVVIPIGFISDHMEVVYDLDTEARELCEKIGLHMVRAGTVGTHPRFITMIRELLVERIEGAADRPALGGLGPCHDVCPTDCCPPPAMRQPATRKPTRAGD